VCLARITKADLDKRKKSLDGFLKKLDKDGRASEKQLLSDLRSAIKAIWMRHPTKLSLLYKNTVVDDDPKSRTKWLFPCNICKGLFKGADIQCDHKIGENSLLSFSDIEVFAKSILGVSWDDLQLLCVECHSYKTYSERYGVSFEQAKALKDVIAVTKLTAAKQKKWLSERGVKPASNQNGRTKQITDVLNKESNN